MRMKNSLSGASDASAQKSSRLRRNAPALCLAAFSAANGLVALWLSAFSCASLDPAAVLGGYFARPSLVLLNVLPPVLLAMLGWFLFGRAWAAYLVSAVPTFGLALVNYYKIQLRGDPLFASDLRLFRTAGGIVGQYHVDLSLLVFLLACGVLLRLLLCVFCLPERLRGKTLRARGVLVSLTLMLLLCANICDSAVVYFPNVPETQDGQIDAETYVSHGFWFSFLRSVADALPTFPENYSFRAAIQLLSQYEDADIPEDEKVQVVGVMLEAFCDLTDFPSLARQANVAAIYEPLHELESRSVSGDLITNIFAGGTVDTEWGFLTGYAYHNTFTAPVDTYVRYFTAQGYDTVFRHPGYSWFYERESINQHLGFDESLFSDTGFDKLVDPKVAIYRSDGILFDYLYDEVASRTAADAPLFSFSVTFQNHGPYSPSLFDGAAVLPENTGWSAETCGILSHYLYNIENTIAEVRRFTEELDELDKPVVVVMFGDHKPWLGNNKSVYAEIGVNLALDTEEGFRNTYETPYFIWANRAAKETLGKDFVGDGGDIAPCLLMEELFDCCGWEGPAFMQLARDMRAVSPLFHWKGRFLVDGKFLSKEELPEDVLEFYQNYRSAEYWREIHGMEAQ